MNIMVFNVPAESAGALSILNDFYEEVKAAENVHVNWIFILSKPKLRDTKNIKVLNFPWIKKSWVHRLYFDYIVAPKLVKKFKINKIISFQNVIIPNVSVKQILYMHNALPFVDYKYGIREDRKLWIYQNIIGKKIRKSVKEAEQVIVQSNWIKQACINKTGISESSIAVIPPTIKEEVTNYFEPTLEAKKVFFYPAGGLQHKNHKIIIEACKKINQTGNYKVIFTLDGDENNHVSRMYQETKNHQLPIKFVGHLSREKIFEQYTKSVLIFPSIIETYGLPLLEARLHKGMVLASDCSYSTEVLKGYGNAHFFNPFEAGELACLMKSVIKGEISYSKTPGTDEYYVKESLLEFLLGN